jgi:hypothetical protein
MDSERMTGKPDVISPPVGLVPTNAKTRISSVLDFLTRCRLVQNLLIGFRVRR